MLSMNFPVSVRIFFIVPTKLPITIPLFARNTISEELGLHSLPGNPTYNLTDISSSEVLDIYKMVLTSFGMQTINEELDLPYIYCWCHSDSASFLLYFTLDSEDAQKSIESLPVHRSVRPIRFPFYSPNC